MTTRPTTYLRRDFRAMNTDVYICAYSNIATASKVLDDAVCLFHSMEKRLSRFLPESELSQLNRSEGVFRASPVLFGAVQTALWAAEATGGLFDPNILPALAQAGYDKSFEQVQAHHQKKEVIDELKGRSSEPSISSTPRAFRQMHLQANGRQISKPQHLKLDLGGIGKGWTVDRVVDRLANLGPFLVNAGGDLYAYSAPPLCTSGDKKTWKINVVHPLNNEPVLTLDICHQAVATSSVTRRCWYKHGEIQHHVIDPRTAKPAETDLLAVTVIADRVALAEVFAKAALIIGAEDGLAYLESIPGADGVLIKADDVLLTTGLTK